MQKLYPVFSWRERKSQLFLLHIISIDDFLMNVPDCHHQARSRSRQICLFVFVVIILRSIRRPSVSFQSKRIIRFSCFFVDFEDGKGSSSIQPHHVALKIAIIGDKSFKSFLILVLTAHRMDLLQVKRSL